MKQEGFNKRIFWFLGIGIILVGIVILGFFNASKNKEPGVYREFSKEEVMQGEVFKLKLDVVVEGDERYYLIEERIPEEFEISEHEGNDHKIKLYEIGNPMESRTYEYKLVSMETGTYEFDGEYALDGNENTSEIKGDNKIVVVGK